MTTRRQGVCDRRHCLLAHAIHEDVGTAVHEDGGHQFILPVVVMGQSSHGRFDAAYDDRHVGVQLLEDAAISNRAVVGSCAGFAFRRISIVGTTSACRRVMVDHRVHRTGRHREIKSRTTEFGEVAIVPVPVRLRHYRYAITCCFEHPTQYSCTERRMVDIRITGEEDDVHFIPAA